MASALSRCLTVGLPRGRPFFPPRRLMAAGHSGRSLQLPSPRTWPLFLSRPLASLLPSPFPLCAPKAPKEDTSRVACPACPGGRRSARLPLLSLPSVGLQSDGNGRGRGCPFPAPALPPPSLRCPSHKFEYSTWPERARLRAWLPAAAASGESFFGQKASEVIPSAATWVGEWLSRSLLTALHEGNILSKWRRRREVPVRSSKLNEGPVPNWIDLIR